MTFHKPTYRAILEGNNLCSQIQPTPTSDIDSKLLRAAVQSAQYVEYMLQSLRSASLLSFEARFLYICGFCCHTI